MICSESRDVGLDMVLMKWMAFVKLVILVIVWKTVWMMNVIHVHRKPHAQKNVYLLILAIGCTKDLMERWISLNGTLTNFSRFQIKPFHLWIRKNCEKSLSFTCPLSQCCPQTICPFICNNGQKTDICPRGRNGCNQFGSDVQKSIFFPKNIFKSKFLFFSNPDIPFCGECLESFSATVFGSVCEESCPDRYPLVSDGCIPLMLLLSCLCVHM